MSAVCSRHFKSLVTRREPSWSFMSELICLRGGRVSLVCGGPRRLRVIESARAERRGGARPCAGVTMYLSLIIRTPRALMTRELKPGSSPRCDKGRISSGTSSARRGRGGRRGVQKRWRGEETAQKKFCFKVQKIGSDDLLMQNGSRCEGLTEREVAADRDRSQSVNTHYRCSLISYRA